MFSYFDGIPQDVKEKAKSVKLILTDVDGVLTDGGIIFDNNGLEYKRFNVKDGMIVHILQAYGIKVGAITGRNSKVVANRCKELKFDFHLHGIIDKGREFQRILNDLDLKSEEVAYIGDDLIDLPILIQVGLSICPADALPYIKNQVDYISSYRGGEGVFREAGDLILESKGLLNNIINDFQK